MNKQKKNPATAANQKPGTIQKDKLNQRQVCSNCPFNDNWLVELQVLSNLHESMGYGPDLASMSLAEKWGLYCHLKRLEA